MVFKKIAIMIRKIFISLRIRLLVFVFVRFDLTVSAQDLTISSAADWDAFALSVSNGETYAGKTVKLAANIRVSTMVGTEAKTSRKISRLEDGISVSPDTKPPCAVLVSGDFRASLLYVVIFLWNK